MKKNVNIRDIPDDLYFQVLEVKASLKAKTWVDFLREVVKLARNAKSK